MFVLTIAFTALLSVLFLRILFAIATPLPKNRAPRILAHKKIKPLKTRHFLILTYIFRRHRVSL